MRASESNEPSRVTSRSICPPRSFRRSVFLIGDTVAPRCTGPAAAARWGGQNRRIMKLKDQVLIVTGGASGIGLEACRALAREGARLIVADFDFDGAERVASELESAGTTAFA